MTWNRTAAAAAVAAVLTAIDDNVSVFATPPLTFNPPAYVVGVPQLVTYDTPSFGIALATLPVSAAAGPGEFDRVDELLELAKDALAADPSLAFAVQSCRPATQANWRVMNIAGADVLMADIVCEIRM